MSRLWWILTAIILFTSSLFYSQSLPPSAPVREYVYLGGKLIAIDSFAGPPSAPSNLSASMISNSRIDLSWTDSSTNESGFRIERKIGQAGSYQEITTVGANVTSYPDTGLSGGTVYYYRVRAYNATGNSAYSNEANACTCTALAGDGVYDDLDSKIAYSGSWNTNLSVPLSYNQSMHYSNTTGSIVSFSFGGSSVRVCILKGSSMGIANVSIDGISQGTIDGYDSAAKWRFTVLYSGLAAGNHTITFTESGTKNAASSNYYLEIDAFGVNADISPAPPSNLSGSRLNGANAYMSWTDNSYNEDGFRIERKTGAGGTYAFLTNVSANTTAYVDSNGLSDLATYYYRVASYKGSLPFSYSGETSANALPQPTSISYSPTLLDWYQNYTATVGNGAGMTIDNKYRYNGGAEQTVIGWGNQNGSGQSSHNTSNSAAGSYQTTGIRNTLNTSWGGVNSTITVIPQPQTFSPGSQTVTQGNNFTINIGVPNITIDVQYQYNGGALQTINGWGTSNGSGNITSSTSGTPTGTYTIVYMRNSSRTDWVTRGGSVTVVAPDEEDNERDK